MSNFTRRIGDIKILKNQLEQNAFLLTTYSALISSGHALLAVRNDEATVYYNGNQLCNMCGMNNYEPTIYNHYLPMTRSHTLSKKLKKENYSEMQWQTATRNENSSFGDVFYEILDNVKKEESPESLQASRFYRFSPLNKTETHEIVLLDIEAAFSETGEKTDRIDLVFYHTVEKRLMFVEVKRLSDSRLYDKEDKNGDIVKAAEVIEQMERYKKRLRHEKKEIHAQYNHVIDCYNALGNCMLPYIGDTDPLLGLLLVEFTRKNEDMDKKKGVQQMMDTNKFKMYAIGDTSSVTKDATIAAIYKKFK